MEQKKFCYISPKVVEQFNIPVNALNLLATFSLSGNVYDYEGEELEDF